MGNEARENARKRGLSPGRPTATEAEQIEERLLAAGWEVLATSNPDKLSLNQVARQAHASKKTLYARWSDKREFMLAMLENRLDALLMIFRKSTRDRNRNREHILRASLSVGSVSCLRRLESSLSG
ncbi:MAG: helix-turn-helix transcriptional regulator [Sphingomonadales bacterium]|nr:helix-turn-helix transcriptional regulator [Sphingomonadales bacterium]